MDIKQNALSFILISFFVISCDALTFEPESQLEPVSQTPNKTSKHRF